MGDAPRAESEGAPPEDATSSAPPRRLQPEELDALLAEVRQLRPPPPRMPRRLVFAAAVALVLLAVLIAVSLLAIRSAANPTTPSTPSVPPSTVPASSLGATTGGATPPRGGRPAEPAALAIVASPSAMAVGDRLF